MTDQTGNSVAIPDYDQETNSVKVDQNTGALKYNYPVSLPQGRGKTTPDVTLTYVNQNASDMDAFGYGWKVSIPYIERISKEGTVALYSTSSPQYFSSSLSGELVQVATSSLYKAKIETGNFLSFQFSSSSWMVIDKDGTQYFFGTASTSRQADANDSSHIAKWYLDKVLDTNGNFATYSYFRDGGAVYPAKITYSHSSSTQGIYQVDFALSATSSKVSFSTAFQVLRQYVVSAINVSTNGTLSHKYALRYGAGINSKRDVLVGITQSGYANNATTTLPETVFTYQGSQLPTWTASQYSGTFPEPLGGYDTGVRFGDLNGDGLTDVVRYYYYSSNDWSPPQTHSVRRVSINKGNGKWDYDVNWGWDDINVPFMIASKGILSNSFSFLDMGTRLIDVNGDGRDDLVEGYSAPSSYYVGGMPLGNINVYINTGTGFQKDTSWTGLDSFSFWNSVSKTVNYSATEFVDANGDGLPDIVNSAMTSTANGSPQANTTSYVKINTGHGWVTDNTLRFPAPLGDKLSLQGNRTFYDMGTRIVDVNGDGLVDVLRGYTRVAMHPDVNYDESSVYLNTGHGWATTTLWSLPENFVDGGVPNRDNILDVNGDHLPEIIRDDSYLGGPNNRVFLNTGANWSQVSYSLPFYLTSNYQPLSTGIAMLDFNGDTVPDALSLNYTDQFETQATSGSAVINDAKPSDQLASVQLSQGGTIAITTDGYLSTTQANYNTVGTSTQNAVVVTGLSYDSGFGNIWSENYNYSNADYYYSSSSIRDRRMTGYGQVTKTTPLSKTTTYYHQGNFNSATTSEVVDDYAKIGLPYQTDITDLNNNLYQRQRTNWATSSIGSGATYVSQTSTLQQDYDGNSDHKDKATSYTYDTSNGAVLTKTEFGLVSGSSDGSFTDSGTDKRTTQLTYATNTSGVVTVSKQTLLNNSSITLAEAKNYFDNQSFGVVTNGNRTKQQNWIASSTYVDTIWTYNGYGLPTSVTDANSHTTNYSYDLYNLFVATTTNALSQKTVSSYDYATGKVATTTNVNGEIYATSYDGLGRPLYEKIPDPQSGATVIQNQYNYVDTTGAVNIAKTSNLSTSTSNTTYTYLDGLGRPIQTRSEAEDVSNYNSKDIVYGVGGLVSKQSLPYFSTGSSFTTATTSNSLYTLFSYDALNRVRSATTSVGTTLTNYDQWQTLVTDPLGHHKELTTDAFGHLTQVDEHNGTSTYTTVYDWDAKDNLLKITDALSNIRNLTYDGLSRRTSIEDLHATGDSTFGAWNFAYDAASNLGTSTNPNGNIVVYTYDSLNRPLTENYQAQVGTEITYTYDSCTKGIGLLCSVNNLNSATTTYTYGHTGKPATEAKTIGGVNYTNAYEYDRTGNQTLLTYPDNSIVRYTYNKGNLLEKVEQRENGGAYRDIVTNFNYNPIGSVVYQLFGNGASTTKTYDDTKLYRLLSIVTSATNPTGGGGEELAQIETGLSLDATDTSTTTMDDISVPTEETLLLDDASITPLLPDSGISTETVLSTSTESVDDADGEKTSPTIDIPLLAETKNLEVVPKNIADITPRETVTTYQLSSSQKDTSKRIDVELSKDTPMVRFKKWNGTADFALSYNSVKGVADYSTERNVTKWSDDSESVEAYPLVAAEGMEEGGLEMEVVLATTSKTNTFNFTVSGADNLDFFYQPPLTQEKLESNIVRCTETDCYDEKGAVVVHRPENIVGSYAVYSKNKKDAISGKVDYGTGKVGHIYRPKVVDAVGTEVWAIMSYQNGMLSITVPQAFLDKAIYPVRVDPTFGYGSVGGTNATTWNYVGSKFQMNNENGTLTKISAYTRKDTAGTMNKIAALYSDAAGSSSILLASSSVTSGVSTTSAWVDMTMPSYALASNTTYWLWQGHDASGWVYWDTGATNQYNIQGVTYPTWPSPFTPGTYFARILSVYATYSTTSASNTAPTAPASLLTEGSINPTNVATTAPKFSAIYTDADTSDKAISYQIQVSTSSSFSSTKWDSGQTTLSASTTQGNRTPDITYAGSALASSTTYYWRIKFWDIAGASGAWSTATNTFMLASSTNATSTATSSSTYPIFVQFPQYLVYSYDAVGNITQIVDRSGTHSAATTTYAYDDLSRLLSASTTQASSTPYSQSYAYNAIGNITYKSDIGNFLYQGATGTLYANPHAATLVNGITYTYDKNGNLASTSASTTNTWNYRNRLTSILKNGTTSTYLYGASDERVSKTTNGITTKYPSQYVDVVGASTTKHIYAGDSLLASVDGSGSTTNSIYFNHLDHLGSTADVTNNIGYLNNLYTYYPYGGSRLEEGAGVGSSSSPTPSPLYIDAVDSSWTDSSWNTTITNSTSTVYSGTKSLKVVYTASWGGVSYARSLNTTPYTTIDFYVYVGTTVPDLYLYFLNQSGTLIQTVTVSDYTTGGLTANTWQHVSVPLSALGIVNYNNLLYFSIESSIPTTVYYDQVQFFGTATNTSAGFSQSNQFIGQNHDYETDLNYLNSRYLNSNNGQFLSEDPVFWEVGQTPDGKAVLTNPQAQNSYSYAQNNPVVQKDPDGRLGWDALSNPYNYGSVLTQVGGWYLASKIFDISGNSFTGSLMRHSLSWNPQSVNVTETNQRFWGNAVNQVKNSSEFKSALNNYLSVDGKNGAIDKTYANSGNGLSSIQFNSGDLEAGIHGTYSTKVTGNQNSDGSWNLNVNISDQYDYRYQGYKGGERNSTLTGANNAARFSQGQNVISDYGVNIKFSLQNYKQKTKQ